MTTATLNKLGNRIGVRGEKTRQAILDATQRLLERRHMYEIRVADVATEAGISSNNFYTYFKTVEEPVLTLCDEAVDAYHSFAAHIDADWTGERAFIQARAYVADVLAFWKDHGRVLRVEAMLADDGHAEFIRTRIRRLRRVHMSFDRKIALAKSKGRQAEALDPRLASYEVVAIVDSVAAGFELMKRANTSAEAIIDTTAHMVVNMVGGR